MPYLIVLFVVLLLLYSIAILRLIPGLDVLLEPIVAVTGKDLTFTGRSEIWAIISEHIRFEPYLGTGYGAYWVHDLGSPSAELIVRLHFYPGSAHNGYLDIINDLGYAGLSCLVGYLVVYIRQSLLLIQTHRTQAALFLGLFLQQSITNLSESHWLCVTSVNFAVMSLATATLARSLLDERLRHYFGAPQHQETSTSDSVLKPRLLKPPFPSLTKNPG